MALEMERVEEDNGMREGTINVFTEMWNRERYPYVGGRVEWSGIGYRKDRGRRNGITEGTVMYLPVILNSLPMYIPMIHHHLHGV